MKKEFRDSEVLLISLALSLSGILIGFCLGLAISSSDCSECYDKGWNDSIEIYQKQFK